MFYNSSNNFLYGDCISHGACSVSPNNASMQEFMFILLKQISYYLIKLHEIGTDNYEIMSEVISQTAVIDGMKDLSEAQILNSFSRQYINLVSARKEYLKTCREKGLKCQDLRNLIKLSPKTVLSTILKRGDREFLLKFKRRTAVQKYLTEILSGVTKSVCQNLINLSDYNQNDFDISFQILKALNLSAKTRVSQVELKECIDKTAKCDIKLLKKLYKMQYETFGEIQKSEVSYSTRPNKAIMVSGSDLKDLASLLNAVNNYDIDVYTNGNLLISHAFPYFKNSKSLKGHFGTGVFNTILDFATFPGAVLLTKNESQNIEYLYRGRLFTTDDITPKGVSKLEKDDFTPLIKSALQAKGFAKGQTRKSETVGFNPDELEFEINKIVEKNPKRIYIIGFSNYSISQQDYFAKFYSLLKDDEQVITFSYKHDSDNVLSINIGNNYPLLYGVMHKLFEKVPINSKKLVFYLTKCDVNTISNIIYLRNNGVSNIFLSDCPPVVINPALLNAFSNFFGIHGITNPQDDIEKI